MRDLSKYMCCHVACDKQPNTSQFVLSPGGPYVIAMLAH